MLNEPVKYAVTGSAKSTYALKSLNVNNPQCKTGGMQSPHVNQLEELNKL